MIRREFLETLDIAVPDDASRFFTEHDTIVFLVPTIDEVGTSIVFTEEAVEIILNDKQITGLKEANCYGETGWTLI